MTKNESRNEDLATMATVELAALADRLRCPDGMRTPFNSAPLPRGRKALLAYVTGFRACAADFAAIERQGR